VKMLVELVELIKLTELVKVSGELRKLTISK